MNTWARTVFPFLPSTLLSLAAACGITPGVLHAAEQSRLAPSLTVSFADLNLTSKQGTLTLYTRIRNAARTVCGPVDIGLPGDWADWSRCVNDTIANSVAKVGDANLTAYYLGSIDRSRTRVAHR